MVAVWLTPGQGALAARLLALDPRLLWATVALLGILLAGALLIWWADRWRKRTAESPESSGDQLSHFRELFEHGQISREEYERIRRLLGQRLRQDLDVSPAEERPAEPPDTGIAPGPPP
jgi:hypothetical protein